MSLEVMVALVREVANDERAQQRIEALSDEQLTALGLDEQEVASIRTGFFDRALQMGVTTGSGPGCCGA